MRGEFSVAASILAEIKRGTSRDLSEGVPFLEGRRGLDPQALRMQDFVPS